ncbi:MAG TPA: sulfotransferase domain-containing protein [Isosphaeraceae bacterium]|nr:sulfotransferase domain-containing protein [Isosphaeraceae bacterium]
MDDAIIIVSGLPRSGTSLMMQMLASGGVEVVTDHVRAADTDNPRGYYEFERVKKIQQDTSWLPEARGKAVKMVSQLLYHLPMGEKYRIIFLERDLDEVLVSQEKMLDRLGRTAAPREAMKQSFIVHLERLKEWLRRRPDVEVLGVGYRELLERPVEEAKRVNEFLGGAADVERMAEAVDPSLYRNRKTPGGGGGSLVAGESA